MYTVAGTGSAGAAGGMIGPGDISSLLQIRSGAGAGSAAMGARSNAMGADASMAGSGGMTGFPLRSNDLTLPAVRKGSMGGDAISSASYGQGMRGATQQRAILPPTAAAAPSVDVDAGKPLPGGSTADAGAAATAAMVSDAPGAFATTATVAMAPASAAAAKEEEVFSPTVDVHVAHRAGIGRQRRSRLQSKDGHRSRCAAFGHWLLEQFVSLKAALVTALFITGIVFHMCYPWVNILGDRVDNWMFFFGSVLAAMYPFYLCECGFFFVIDRIVLASRGKQHLSWIAEAADFADSGRGHIGHVLVVCVALATRQPVFRLDFKASANGEFYFVRICAILLVLELGMIIKGVALKTILRSLFMRKNQKAVADVIFYEEIGRNITQPLRPLPPFPYDLLPYAIAPDHEDTREPLHSLRNDGRGQHARHSEDEGDSHKAIVNSFRETEQRAFLRGTSSDGPEGRGRVRSRDASVVADGTQYLPVTAATAAAQSSGDTLLRRPRSMTPTRILDGESFWGQAAYVKTSRYSLYDEMTYVCLIDVPEGIEELAGQAFDRIYSHKLDLEHQRESINVAVRRRNAVLEERARQERLKAEREAKRLMEILAASGMDDHPHLRDGHGVSSRIMDGLLHSTVHAAHLLDHTIGRLAGTFRRASLPFAHPPVPFATSTGSNSTDECTASGALLRPQDDPACATVAVIAGRPGLQARTPKPASETQPKFEEDTSRKMTIAIHCDTGTVTQNEGRGLRDPARAIEGAGQMPCPVEIPLNGITPVALAEQAKVQNGHICFEAGGMIANNTSESSGMSFIHPFDDDEAGAPCINKDDLRDCFDDLGDLEAAFRLLDLDGDGSITRDELISSIKLMHGAWIATQTSLQSYGGISGAVSMVVSTLFAIIVLLVGLAILEISFNAFWLPLSTVILGFSFAFSSALQRLLDSLIFVLLVSPYDVGDRISVVPVNGGGTLIVRAVNVLTTECVDMQNRIYIIRNSELSSYPIINHRRSSEAGFVPKFYVDMSVTTEQITELRIRVLAFLRTRPLEWKPALSVSVSTMDANKMELTLWINHQASWQEGGKIWTSLAYFNLAVAEIMSNLGIRYQLPPQPYRSAPPHGYSEAELARREENGLDPASVDSDTETSSTTDSSPDDRDVRHCIDHPRSKYSVAPRDGHSRHADTPSPGFPPGLRLRKRSKL
jgi:hypothetical protein